MEHLLYIKIKNDISSKVKEQIEDILFAWNSLMLILPDGEARPVPDIGRGLNVSKV